MWDFQGGIWNMADIDELSLSFFKKNTFSVWVSLPPNTLLKVLGFTNSNRLIMSQKLFKPSNRALNHYLILKHGLVNSSLILQKRLFGSLPLCVYLCGGGRDSQNPQIWTGRHIFYVSVIWISFISESLFFAFTHKNVNRELVILLSNGIYNRPSLCLSN